MVSMCSDSIDSIRITLSYVSSNIRPCCDSVPKVDLNNVLYCVIYIILYNIHNIYIYNTYIYKCTSMIVDHFTNNWVDMCEQSRDLGSTAILLDEHPRTLGVSHFLGDTPNGTWKNGDPQNGNLWIWGDPKISGKPISCSWWERCPRPKCFHSGI